MRSAALLSSTTGKSGCLASQQRLPLARRHASLPAYAAASSRTRCALQQRLHSLKPGRESPVDVAVQPSKQPRQQPRLQSPAFLGVTALAAMAGVMGATLLQSVELQPIGCLDTHTDIAACHVHHPVVYPCIIIETCWPRLACCASVPTRAALQHASRASVLDPTPDRSSLLHQFQCRVHVSPARILPLHQFHPLWRHLGQPNPL